MRHPDLVRRRSEIACLILDTACLVDQTLRFQRQGRGAPPPRLLAEADQARRRLLAPELFVPPPPPPPPSAPHISWREALRETLPPARRAALKMARSAFIAVVVTQLLGYPAGGALFAALTVSLQVSSGTAISKSLLLVAGLGLALAVVMLIVLPFMPNLEDPGSFL